ncbi:MAG: hypothetical protein TREMPRED_001108 [Tremellales sp. Tagirdzhanova-0007]|nr:MAG: hypothetical protein TREMPRED_001108 [Tremellales sp. Tagirdzhanova-0007]
MARSLFHSSLRTCRSAICITGRSNSTSSSSTTSASAPDATTPNHKTPQPTTSFPRLNLFDLPDDRPSGNKWWTDASHLRVGQPGNVYSGRTFPVMRSNDFMGQYKRLQSIMLRTGVRRELKRKEYHEGPSEKRVRLASERHRRRFAHMVREKVHLVQLLRNRS